MISIRKNFFYNTAYHLLTLLAPLVTTPYLSRVLSASGIGTYSYAFTITSYFTIFILLGLENYGSREIASHNHNKDELSHTFCGIYYMQLILGIIITCVYIGYCLLFADDKIFSLIFTINIITSILDVNWFLSGTESFSSIAIRNMVAKTAMTALIFIFIKGPDDVMIYCIIMLLSNLFSVLIMWPKVFRSIYICRMPFKDIFKHLKPNLYLFMSVVSVLLLKTIDKFMLGIMDSSKVQLGYYELAERIISIPNILVTSLGTVMLSRVSNLISDGDKEYRNAIINTMIFSMLVVSSMSFGIMSVTKEFIPLFYGDGYDACVSLYLTMLPCSIFMSFANVIRTNYMLPNKMDKYVVISGFVALAVNVVANALLIPKFFAWGAAIGTLIAEVVDCVMQCVFTRKHLPLTIYLKYAAIMICIGGAMFAVLYFCNFGAIISSTVAILFIKIAVGMLIFILLTCLYFVIAYRFGDENIIRFVSLIFKKKNRKVQSNTVVSETTDAVSDTQNGMDSKSLDQGE